VRQQKSDDRLWLYGHHAVRAALANPHRTIKRIVLTERSQREFSQSLLARVRSEIVTPDAVARLLPQGAVHQGVALSCNPLPKRDLDDILSKHQSLRRIVLILDQISDPQNVGAVLRTAAAFDVSAVVVQDRHAPPESGALAKAASGALDAIPYVRTVNLARTVELLADAHFWRISLAGDGDVPLSQAVGNTDVALVLGSEGSGIRRLVRERCDTSAYIPIGRGMESLNVSAAAAIALYECRRSP